VKGDEKEVTGIGGSCSAEGGGGLSSEEDASGCRRGRETQLYLLGGATVVFRLIRGWTRDGRWKMPDCSEKVDSLTAARRVGFGGELFGLA
jgi:hypothetical protein